MQMCIRDRDICFVKGGPGAYADFIEAYTGRKLEHGTFTDPQGRVFGTHEGIARYTIGQRKGVRTACGRPLYVIAKNAADHTVVMGEDALLYSDTVRVKEFNLLYPDYDPDHLTAKHRYEMCIRDSCLRSARKNAVCERAGARATFASRFPLMKSLTR